MSKKIIFLFLIFSLAFFLRFYKLSAIPLGFMDDEASIGYNAYSVFKTGKDEWGRFLPLTNFKGFGEYKLPFTIYLTLVSEIIFGVNEFAVRFPSAFFGTLTVLITYFLVKELFRESKQSSVVSYLPLLSSFFLAISPWHIFLNRFGHEANIALFFTLLGLYLFLLAKRKEILLPLSFLCFVITFYTYHAYQIFLPLFLVFLFLLYRKWLWQLPFRIKITSILIFLLLSPLFLSLFSQGGARFSQVGIFNNAPFESRVSGEKNKCLSIFPSPICTLGYNKPLHFSNLFFQNYLTNFSFYALFVRSNYDPKHVTPTALFYLFEFPLIVLGLLALIKIKEKALLILLPWLLLFPLPHSLTEFGAIARMVPVFPVFQIFSAAGIIYLLSLAKTKKFLITLPLIFIITFSFGKFLADYFFYYPRVYAQFSQYGRKPIYEYLKSVEGKHKHILIENSAANYIQLAFFAKYDPALFQKERNKPHLKLQKGEVLAKIRNWYVVDSLLTEGLDGDDLLIFFSEHFPKGLKSLKVFKYPNGSEFAEVVTVSSYLDFQKRGREK